MDELDPVRREAIRILCDAQARDRLAFEDFEDRLERIKVAPNPATIDAIVADLQDPELYDLAPTPSLEAPAVTGGPVAPADFIRISSVFASTKRAGSWTVPFEIHALVILGEMTLDLRDAVFGTDVVDIQVNVTLGAFRLILPAGTQVENEIEETLASSQYSPYAARATRSASPNGLLVRLRGRALLASVEIKERLPTALLPARGGFLRRLLGPDSGG